MVRAPGLFATFWDGEAFWQGVESLETELAGDVAFVLGEYLLAELLLEVAADYPYYLAEAGLDGVVDAVVHNALSLGTEGVELFETAVTAAHACCK